MNNINAIVSAFLFSLTLLSASFAQQRSQIPSHCGADEFAYLNAHMSKIHNFPEPVGGWKKGDKLYELRKTGKVLSLCTSGKKAPHQSVTYRYGAIGKIEMEKVSTPAEPFGILTRQTTPRTGENIIFFKSAQYVYCVSEALGMGSGIGLTVLKSGKEIVNLFSGNEEGVDFETSLIDINFEKPNSPSLRHVPYSNKKQMPCDSTP